MGGVCAAPPPSQRGTSEDLFTQRYRQKKKKKKKEAANAAAYRREERGEKGERRATLVEEGRGPGNPLSFIHASSCVHTVSYLFYQQKAL